MIFLSQIQPKWKVLDIGAGDGYFSNIFAQHGANVVAVDTQIPSIKHSMISTKKISIDKFIEQSSSFYFDAIFMRNIIQFLNKTWVFETLFPWTNAHLNTNGVIAIETFFQNPIPPFNQPIKALFTVEELLKQFPDWRTLLMDSYEHDSLDMQGNQRHFFTTDLIIQNQLP